MKKIALLLFLCVFLPATVAYAQESSASATPSPTAVPSYQLPYPGILPDNPLYMLKTFRDGLVAFFISDPLKKSAFYLLQSDKRLESSWYLLKKGQSEEALALSTLSKSNNYFDMAIAQLKLAKASGEDTSSLFGSLQASSNTHVGVVEQMAVMGKNNRSSWMSEETRVKNMARSVSSISPK